MKTQTEKILNVLRIIAWIGYVGSIVVAIVIIGFSIALFFIPSNADFTKALFITDRKLPFLILKNEYLGRLVFYLILGLLKCYFVIKVWKLVKDTLTDLNIISPFSAKTAISIEKVAYLMIVISVVDFFTQQYVSTLEGLTTNHVKYNFSLDLTYIFVIGIVYLISQIFKRGIEIQEENDLTV
jgi:hypothetical protein